MRSYVCLALLLAVCPVFSQTKTEKRLTGLEKRVSKVEKRVNRLEEGGSAALAAAAPAEQEPAAPIAVQLLKKKQVVGQERIGVKLYLEFENVSNRRYYAFNGVLVFRDAAGAVVWTKAYGYSDQLQPGQRVPVTLAVSSEQTKEYLKLLKAGGLTVSLEKQEAYGAD